MLLVAVTAHAKVTLQLAELPALRQPAPSASHAVRLELMPLDENLRAESTLLMLSVRAQQLADPRGRQPMFVPALSTTCIGGSLRLDF